MISENFSFEYEFLLAVGILLCLFILDILALGFVLLKKLRAKIVAKRKNKKPKNQKSKKQSFFKRLTSRFKKKNKSCPLVSKIQLKSILLGKIPTTESRKKHIDSQNKKISKKIKNLLLKFKRFVVRIISLLWKFKLIIIHILGVGFVVFLIFDLFAHPDSISKYPDDNVLFEPSANNVTVTYDRPINEEIIAPYIFPEIEGEWKFEPVDERLPWFKRKVTFYPKETIFPNSKIFIYYAGIANMFYPDGNGWEFGINTFSAPAPEIVESFPEKDSIDVGVDSTVEITFDKTLDKYAEWKLVITPEAEYTSRVEDDKLYFEFSNHLAQSTQYTFELIRTLVRYNIQEDKVIEKAEPETLTTSSFQTIKEPLINSMEPQGTGVLIDAPIKIVFDQPMDQPTVEERFTITPEINGEFEWLDEVTLNYKHDNFSKNTQYTIKLAPQMRSLKGGFVENEVVHNFTSIGYVAVSSFYPGNGATGVKRSYNININFNQQVDHASAQSKFSISPTVAGAFSWDGNTMIFNPSADFGYTSTYTVSIAAGIKTIHGLDSTQAFSTKFTTEQQYFVLNVPVRYQVRRFECNLVAASMALSYKGSWVSSSGLYSRIAKDPTPYSNIGGVVTWGNPYAGFVGDINGNPKGYGVYWGPLSAVMNSYRSTSVRTGWDRTALLQEVQKGNPVIIWAHNGYSSSPNGAVGSNISWKTPSGTSIYAIAGMHSYVVVGWIGDIGNPSNIILNDPNRGRWTISTSYFNGLWSYFNRSAVVVY